MNKLEEFTELLKGRFNNKEQYDSIKTRNDKFPYAEHVNSICNNKITNLPDNFKGIFMVEESYYSIGDKTNPMPHLFLFTQEDEGIKLTSYDMPEGFTKENFKYENIESLDYENLSKSQKFTPAIYKKSGSTWQGGSVSMFTPVLKFTLSEKFSEDCLEVFETMEVNGKRTFGYDDPIIYKRA